MHVLDRSWIVMDSPGFVWRTPEAPYLPGFRLVERRLHDKQFPLDASRADPNPRKEGTSWFRISLRTLRSFRIVPTLSIFISICEA